MSRSENILQYIALTRDYNAELGRLYIKDYDSMVSI